jgi:CRISPR/Cas system-associated exonuclease Cas4 (RecB family)
MLTADYIAGKISAFVQSEIKVYPCEHLRASNIGHPCERYLYLLIKHWEEVKPHDEGLQNIFDFGNSVEAYTIQKLKDAGLEVITPTQRSWKVLNPLITGREDIRIKDPETGQLYPAEIKGLSPMEWERLNSIDDFYTSKRYYVRGYPAQLMVYCWKFEKEIGFFVLTNKLTGEIKIIDVPFDWQRADALLKKGERIYKALETDTPPDSCDDISVCESCGLRHICTAAIDRAEMEIDDGELEAAIDRKNELSPAYREYQEIGERIKRIVGEREKVLAGQYVVMTKVIDKKGFTVEPRQERRITIKRL